MSTPRAPTVPTPTVASPESITPPPPASKVTGKLQKQPRVFFGGDAVAAVAAARPEIVSWLLFDASSEGGYRDGY